MEDSTNPKVSIAVCTYNGEKFLREQLDSLVNQTYPNIEIVIVDDCSTDSTPEICQSYQQPNLFFHQNEENLGYTGNFEKAITLCTGDYICLCDQDDVWEHSKIETLVNEIGDHLLIYHDSNFIDHNGKQIGEETMGSRYRMYDGESALPFLLSNCISGHAAMFSIAIIPYLFPFDKRFYHDWWIAYVAFNLGKVKYLDQVLVGYRQHQDSITDNLKIKSLPKDESPRNRIKVDLAWLKKCAEFSENKQPELIKKAYRLFNGIKDGKNRFALFRFIVRYYDLLFYIISPKKSQLSKINQARKICFSATPPFYDQRI